eukprot:CAMPEP_0178928376 /NCGR_PEP_ID=MMETSP0786-20121207/19862_1 /TAXON_ID=186022 /ORGANISM="Thalassionema frauenfeldii, Strain CCMP 1798" /LENGTH=1163 /DNA_ID=CAMNT_0020604219 /DNA_START=39 /DNA_END=3530 /DNA_ORIENTATION=-
MTLVGNGLNPDLIDNNASDSFAIARAFRGASDADINQALDAMARPSLCNEMKYFLVPCSWMSSCLPFLLGQNDQRPTLRIGTSTLLSTEGTVSDEEEEHSKTDFKPRDRSNQRHHQLGSYQQSLRRDLHLGRDFHCVGINVWNLISEKFGYEIELGFPVVALENGGIAIDIPETQQQIPIPPTGRFDYEALSPTDIVSDDEDDLFPEPSGLSPRFSLPQDITTTTEDHTSKSNAIILLPSSQTPPTQQSTSDEMEIEPIVRKRKRHGSGLGNLGNTCFMNSTLQCLAHTEPLRRYFLSGDYENDLNRSNPLGTGGELATRFAELLSEMWITSGNAISAGVVYPRSFKHTLGKHAEQFLGYDQHDSQELATYLLDALHEDTNRVTKKPYIEKPEQEENEPDGEAADKAWNLHLQREDSKVLENFMGQVKSRVQCPKEGCGRVSTTFDPFMYLSVPIPGATDRTLKVTLVPLKGLKHEIMITMHKSGTLLTLQKKVCEQWHQYCGDSLEVRDMIAVDVWNGEIYSVYKENDEIDKIRDTDVTYIYQMVPSARLIQEEKIDDSAIVERPMSRSRSNRIKLPVEDLTEINSGEKWRKEIDKHVQQMTLMSTLLNPKRATTEGLLRFYDKLGVFLDNCYEALEISRREYEGQVENVDEAGDDHSTEGGLSNSESLEDFQERALLEVCYKDPLFTEVSGAKEVARLEFCEKKFYQYIIKHIDDDQNKYRDGIDVQVIFQRRESSGLGSIHQRTVDKTFTAPLCLRVPGDITVYRFRKLLAERLPLKDNPVQDTAISSENNDTKSNGCNEECPVVESPSAKRNGNKTANPNLLIMRQIPMGFSDQRNGSYGTYRSHYSTPCQLGMLERLDESDHEGPAPVHLADSSDEEECKKLSDCIGQNGQIFLYWPSKLCEQFFDVDRYEGAVQVPPPETEKEENKNDITVLQCIEKYCQMEQLEETEMWFCNRCKEHVRAWKQFHIYRAPPILIIHLKRFHYSASTHRRDKIDTFIDFPLKGLDLTSEVMHWVEESKPIYDCYAVSNHYGGLGGGHYTAYALNDDGTWGNYDDSRVSANIDPKDVVSSAAYVLYYRRRDVVFDSTPDFSTPDVVQDYTERRNVARIDSMDLDERRSSSSSTMADCGPVTVDNEDVDDGDDYYNKADYDSDHLPSAQ